MILKIVYGKFKKQFITGSSFKRCFRIAVKAKETHDAFSEALCEQRADEAALRCHAKGLAGPKDCYGLIRRKVFEDCMEASQ